MAIQKNHSMKCKLFYLFIWVGLGGTSCVAITDVPSAPLVSDETPITKHIQALSNAIKLKNTQLAAAQASLKTAKPGSPEATAAADKVATLNSDIALLITQKVADEYVDSSLKDANDLVNTFKQAQQEADLAEALVGDDDSANDTGGIGDTSGSDDAADDGDAGRAKS